MLPESIFFMLLHQLGIEFICILCTVKPDFEGIPQYILLCSRLPWEKQRIRLSDQVKLSAEKIIWENTSWLKKRIARCGQYLFKFRPEEEKRKEKKTNFQNVNPQKNYLFRTFLGRYFNPQCRSLDYTYYNFFVLI